MHLGQPVVDCDLHVNVPNAEALFPYLSDYWREYIQTSAFKGPVDTAYPPNAPTTVGPATNGASSTLADIQQQVLDPWGTEIAILNCVYAVDSLHHPDTAASMAAAVNDWLIAEWLDKDTRLRASLLVPTRVPEMGAAEIDRIGKHPGFVQVLLPVRSEAPYGNRRYLPIFEAAVRNNLVVSLQFGGSPGNPPTGSGWPSYYIEEYVGMAQVFQTQVLSMIVEGVFDRFPELRVALIESGWTWLPSLMWRIDKDWKGLRREVPWNTRLPSAYIRERMRVSLQPMDAPTDPQQLLTIIDHLGSDDLLMFSTDYPHWHFTQPEEAVPSGLSPTLQRKILRENARAFYQLP